jgi:hypothetical protein
MSCLLSATKVGCTVAELLIDLGGGEGGKLSCGGIRDVVLTQQTSSAKPCVQAVLQDIEFAVYLRKDSE